MGIVQYRKMKGGKAQDSMHLCSGRFMLPYTSPHR